MNWDVSTHYYGANNWYVGSTQGTVDTQTTSGTRTQDTIHFAGGLRIDFSYQNNIDNPLLPPPDPNADTQPHQNWPGAVPASVADSYYEVFSGELDQAAQNHHLSASELDAIIFGQMTGKPPTGNAADGTPLSGILHDIESHVAEQMAQSFDFPPVSDQSKAIKERGNALVTNSQTAIAALEEEIQKMPNGPEKEALKNLLQQLKGQLADLQGILAKANNASSQEDINNLLKELNQNLASLSDTAEQANDITGDPATGNLVANVRNAVSDGVKSLKDVTDYVGLLNDMKNGNYAPATGVVQNAYMKAFGQAFQDAFQADLSSYAKENGLTDAQQKQLIFAMHDIADGKWDDTSPEAQKMFQAILASGSNIAKVYQEWGAPKGYIPNVDSSTYFASITSTYDDLFEQQLDSFDLSQVAKELGISENEAAGLIRYLHYNPQATFAGSSKLGAIVGELDHNAMQQLTAEFGLPSGYSVQPGTFAYNASINGEFLRMFDNNLRNSGLTPQQISAVLAVLADPTNPNITNETMQILQNLYNQTVGQIRSQFQLPSDWAPPGTLLSELPKVPPSMHTAWAGINQVDEQIHLAAAAIQQLPDGPGKTILLNVLAIVSKALEGLKVQLAQMQVLDTKLAAKVSEAQKEAVQQKIALAMKKMREMRKKKKKMKPFTKFMNVFEPMMMAMTIAMLVGAGPLGIAMGAFMISSKVSGFDPMNKMFDEIKKGTEKLASVMGLPPEVGSLMSMAASALVASALVGTFGLGNPTIAFTLFFENSGIIQTFFTDVCHVNPMAGQVINMVCEMAVQITMEVILMVVMEVVTAGGGTPIVAAWIAEKVAVVTAKVVNMVVKVLAEVIRLVAKVSQKLADMLTKMLNKLINVVGKLMKYAEKMAQKAKDINEKAIQLEKKAKEVKELRGAYKAMEKGGDQAKSAARAAAKQKFKFAQEEYHELTNIFKEMCDDVFAPLKWFDRGITALEIVGQVSVAAGQTSTAGVEVIKGQMAKKLSRLDAEIAEVEGLIKILKKVLDDLMKAIQGMGEQASQIAQVEFHMWGELRQSMDAIAGANQAA